jgi:ubiquinone/menaquinone biosynthesis C-methylase UbiE
MAANDSAFAGSIPEIYDRFLVPLIFEAYANDLARRVASIGPKTLLEVAAGTGALTTAMIAALPKDVRIVATDLNQPMLDHAARKIRNDHVEWKQADALNLPFADATFDAVACQFGVMFFPDRIAGYRQMHRVLKPGGRLLFNAWDEIRTNEFAAAVTEAVRTLFPNDPPEFLPRTPYGYHDADRIRSDLTAAGFTDIAVDAVDARSKATSARDVAIGFCQGTPLRAEIEARKEATLEQATARAAHLLAQRFGAGAVDGRIRALVVTARR